MTTTAKARARSAAIVVFSAVALLALILSLRANATQASVAQREARRVAAELEEQQHASCAFWRHLGAFEGWEAGSEIGRVLVTDARATADDLECPP